MRGNDHTAAILTTVVERTIRRLNPGYTDEVYREALRQLTRLADNPDLMVNNHYFHKLLIEGLILIRLNGTVLLRPTSSLSKEVMSVAQIRPYLLMGYQWLILNSRMQAIQM